MPDAIIPPEAIGDYGAVVDCLRKELDAAGMPGFVITQILDEMMRCHFNRAIDKAHVCKNGHLSHYRKETCEAFGECKKEEAHAQQHAQPNQ